MEDFDNCAMGADTGAPTGAFTPKMVQDAVSAACDFFCLPEAPVVDAAGVCVWPNDPTTTADDVFGFNRDQLLAMGMSGEDTLTLVYTHECAHRALQGAYNEAWPEELACDFFAGLHAQMKGMDLDNFEASLGSLPGTESHPSGALRAEFIEYGKQVAQEMAERGVQPTFDGCVERFNAHLEEKAGLIAEYQSHVGDTMPSDDEGAKGLFVNNKAFHEKEARDAMEQANYHTREASRAAERGDFSASKDHASKASSYDAAARDHMRAAGQCTE